MVIAAGKRVDDDNPSSNEVSQNDTCGTVSQWSSCRLKLDHTYECLPPCEAERDQSTPSEVSCDVAVDQQPCLEVSRYLPTSMCLLAHKNCGTLKSPMSASLTQWVGCRCSASLSTIRTSIRVVVPPSGNAGAGRKTHNPSGNIGKFHSLQEPHGGLGKKNNAVG